MFRLDRRKHRSRREKEEKRDIGLIEPKLKTLYQY